MTGHVLIVVPPPPRWAAVFTDVDITPAVLSTVSEPSRRWLPQQSRWEIHPGQVNVLRGALAQAGHPVEAVHTDGRPYPRRRSTMEPVIIDTGDGELYEIERVDMLQTGECDGFDVTCDSDGDCMAVFRNHRGPTTASKVHLDASGYPDSVESTEHAPIGAVPMTREDADALLARLGPEKVTITEVG